MQQTIARTTLLEAIRVRLGESPVVALLGARQVGKTTLSEQVAAAWEGPTVVFDLERTATREALSATPEKLLSEQVGLVIVDKVQRMPELTFTTKGGESKTLKVGDHINLAKVKVGDSVTIRQTEAVAVTVTKP